MIIISHRGNLFGPNASTENVPAKIMMVLSHGIDVEIDVWFSDAKWYLGHDKPTYEIPKSFILQKGLWCHAKNLAALYQMSLLKVEHYFWHENDSFTLTSSGKIWAYPGQALTLNSIAVMPELAININPEQLTICYGVCTDYVNQYSTCNF